MKHFSKYGLVDDSDEENELETDPKKLKLLQDEQLTQLAIQVPPPAFSCAGD